MGREIERKFLVKGDAWRKLARGVRYRQGYLSATKQCTVRVRTVGERAYLTVKGPTVGNTRAEFEYEIPTGDANEMLDGLCERPLIEKRRHRIMIDRLTWEVDEFEGANRGLIVAEVELGSEGQDIRLPEWIGNEVSNDPRYYNANLIRHPYSAWRQNATPSRR